MGGEGLEPPKALGRLIYSQQLLPLSDPPLTIENYTTAETTYQAVHANPMPIREALAAPQ